MIAAGIGSRKGVSAAEVVAAVEAALEAYGVEREALGRLATMEIKRGERGIFEAGDLLGVEVVVVPAVENEQSEASARMIPVESSALPLTCLPASSPRERGEERAASTLSLTLAGVHSVSEAAALAAAGPGARLFGPRIAVGRVTCAIAFGEEQ